MHATVEAQKLNLAREKLRRFLEQAGTRDVEEFMDLLEALIDAKAAYRW